MEVFGRGVKPRPTYLTGVGRDALTDRCGGGEGDGGGSITSAGCVGCGGGIVNAGRLGGGGEVDVVGFGMGRGHVVRAAGGGGGGDITAGLCRRTGCSRLRFIVGAAAAAAAMTIGSGEVTEVVLVLPVAVVVGVGVVTVVLWSVSSNPMNDTAVARRGCGAGGVFLTLSAVHDVNIPGGTHAKRPRTWDNLPSLSISICSCKNTDKLPVTIYSHLYYNTLLSGFNHAIIIIHKTTQQLLSGLNHLITSIKLIKRVKLEIHKLIKSVKLYLQLS